MQSFTRSESMVHRAERLRAWACRLPTLGLLILATPGVARAFDITLPPEIPAEQMPHCTWDWERVNPKRIEFRDGELCAGPECIDRGFYDPISLAACGFEAAERDQILHAYMRKGRPPKPVMENVRAAVVERAAAFDERREEAQQRVSECLEAKVSARLLTDEQAAEAASVCAAALETFEAAGVDVLFLEGWRRYESSQHNAFV